MLSPVDTAGLPHHGHGHDISGNRVATKRPSVAAMRATRATDDWMPTHLLLIPRRKGLTLDYREKARRGGLDR